MDEILKKISAQEEISYIELKDNFIKGEIVILQNNKWNRKNVCAVGKNLSVKVNANIGTSPLSCDLDTELKKLNVAEKYGADTVMDLSTGGDISKIRKIILESSSIPLGTVPIYQSAVKAKIKYNNFNKMTAEEMLENLEQQLADGVDFVTIHCGINKKAMETLNKTKRLMGIVSRGGALLAQWMQVNKCENPFYEHFDKVMEICKKYNATISLGDALRPGCGADATDAAQIQELITLGELVLECRKYGVQAMVEGPGHIPLNQIQANIQLQKKLCHNAPFYVLGPLVTDVAPGYDHISGAIGGALAAMYGADFLCYLTPAEHLGLPTVEDVKEGVIASKIAAHCVDIARGKQKAINWDSEMSVARKNLDWTTQISLALDSQKAKEYHQKQQQIKNNSVCTMCGEFCAYNISGKIGVK